MFWSWLSHRWARCGMPWSSFSATVLSWQRKRFRDHWASVGRVGKPGRPPISKEVRELIRKVSCANPWWGTPRILGELGKLGIEAAKSTVDKYDSATQFTLESRNPFSFGSA
jgi:putative transposase